MPIINIERFFESELKIASITTADPIPNSNKLLKLTVDLGDESRTLVAGIAKDYSCDELVGRQIVMVANLEPVRLMGVESQGMILAASEEGRPVLLQPDRAVPAGTAVK